MPGHAKKPEKPHGSGGIMAQDDWAQPVVGDNTAKQGDLPAWQQSHGAEDALLEDKPKGRITAEDQWIF